MRTKFYESSPLFPSSSRFWFVVGGALLAFLGGDDGRAEKYTRGELRYGEPKLLANLACRQITESSGLASSQRTAGVFWTHNDSGDKPRLFAVNLAGEDLGSCRLTNAKAIDWEDIASFRRDDKSWLVVADIGDNAKRRTACQLYLLEEPAIATREVNVQEIQFRYEDGPHDCESIAVDAAAGLILLTVKTFGLSCAVFQLPLQPTSEETIVARKLTTIPVSFAVAMDISPDSRRAIVLTYGDAFEFSKSPEESWKQAFGRVPRRISMPRRSQGESICYGSDGKSLFLTSERLPAPLWQVPAELILDQSPEQDQRPTPFTNPVLK